MALSIRPLEFTEHLFSGATAVNSMFLPHIKMLLKNQRRQPSFPVVVILAMLTCVALASNFGEIPDFSSRKIVLLHLHDNAPFFGELGALTFANKQRYCKRHGYDLASWTPHGVTGLWKEISCDDPNAIQNPHYKSYDPEGASDRSAPPPECISKDTSFAIDARAPTFGKIKLTLAACRTRPDYWALWSDADAMIINQTVALETIIDDSYDVMLSVDWLMLNAGVLLFKCSKWTQTFLERVYAAREFDEARALDQSAFQHFLDTEPNSNSRVKRIPKYSINVYAEEYQPGDFLLHMAGKLYEMTTAGATAVAHQFDVLSTIDDITDIESFFQGQYFLTSYSGVCDITIQGSNDCPPEDSRRIKLKEPLLAMSAPNRYRHVGLRYYWLQDWKDIYDVHGWNNDRTLFDPTSQFSTCSNSSSAESTRRCSQTGSSSATEHDEL